ncbi:aspartyl-phosphate phosphatase Spo0E family protein [Aquibacillus sp. 3ASR75-11]|uniref:Aspartyl-phosphate phosphatase Spo0E family protein n=1 Tax=Terrihalobacillus insolitus TaxID=2950438 RepID=A0A9X4APS8_9BACI|nr:aspartyl-phosphate phosphatase Spo0E family protein [Terrihalobacillus insolitus]MDC3414992.1 aspartyl-phosphate phosphatase Spo0E family protein [Terrihalobacillus insolitus]MDC3425873.1 aspartyl-phosphate phosphatase Spo0E family protein [Terrihalobacillus insolitus]
MSNIKSINSKISSKKIEKKRKQMINDGLRYGLSHKKTVMKSKELDALLNMHQKA